MTQIPTTEEIELMKSADLVKHHNELAPLAGRSPVKKFESREVGIKRLITMCDLLRTAQSAPVVAVEELAPTIAEVKTTAEMTNVGNNVVAFPSKTDEDPAEAAAAAIRSGAKAKDAIRATAPAAAKPEKAPKPAKEKKPTIAARVRELIAQGLDNAQIWAKVQPEFNILDKHRGMVSWYRNDLLRRQKREQVRAS